MFAVKNALNARPYWYR